MSQNPFQPTAPNPYQHTPPRAPGAANAKPTGVTIFAVICLLLGLAGMGLVCVSGMGLGAMPFLIQTIENAPDSAGLSDDEKQAAVATLRLAQEKIGIQIGILIVNLVVAMLLIVGSIGALTGKTIGLFRLATLVAAIYVVLRFIVATVFIQLPMIDKLKEIPGAVEDQFMPPIVNLAIGAVVILCMAGFYVWAHIYSRSAPVKQFFGS